jgi:hypothetical protein
MMLFLLSLSAAARHRRPERAATNSTAVWRVWFDQGDDGVLFQVRGSARTG